MLEITEKMEEEKSLSEYVAMLGVPIFTIAEVHQKIKTITSKMSCTQLSRLVYLARIVRDDIGLSYPMTYFILTTFIHYGSKAIKQRCSPHFDQAK